MKLRKATQADSAKIWTILQDAIAQRKQDGSKQWQDGYPNEAAIANDIEQQWGYVLIDCDEVVAYAAISFDGEPAYDNLEGEWLTTDTYVIIHRLATAKVAKGKGYALSLIKLVEQLAVEREVFSLKIDTNFDNGAMLHILKKLGYTYCGEVSFRGDYRKAFEKILTR